MKYENEKLGCSFVVPDRPTVRQQLAYWSAMRAGEVDEPQTVLSWGAAVPLLEDWTCAAIPDPQTSLDEMSNPSQALIVVWVGNTVFAHFQGLADVPKN